jgi:hypothetical protein
MVKDLSEPGSYTVPASPAVANRTGILLDDVDVTKKVRDVRMFSSVMLRAVDMLIRAACALFAVLGFP